MERATLAKLAPDAASAQECMERKNMRAAIEICVISERERCAKIAEEIAVIHGGIYDYGTCERIAAAIRSGK